MEIEFNSKSDFRIALLVMWSLASVFILGAVFLGPARNEDGVVYDDWQSRAVIGEVIILAMIILPTWRRQTIVSREGKFLRVYDKILFVVPIWSTTFAISDVTSIRFNVSEREDHRDIATLSVHSARTKRRILFRHDQGNFRSYRRIAEELSRFVGVPLTDCDAKKRTKSRN